MRMADDFRISLPAARVNAGMTLEQACEAIKVSKTTMSKWENGKTAPTIEKAEQLADLYKIPINRINFCRQGSI